MIGIPLQTTTVHTTDGISKTISDIETDYPISQTDADSKTSGLPVPYQVLSRNLLGTSNIEITYSKHDSTSGNLLEYKLKNLLPVTLIWGYNNTLPIAKIEGATYSQVSPFILDIIDKSNLDATQGTTTSENNLLESLNSFRKNSTLKNYQITTYTYDPLIGVKSITPPSGITEFYKYDTFNRLEKIVNNNNEILKEYQYHYKQ